MARHLRLRTRSGFNMNKVRMSCAALLLAACSIAGANAQQSAILERIIVKVNGEILTQTQLENRQIQELRDQNKQVENRKALSNDDVRKALIEITPALLVDEVNTLLLVQRAREMNIKYNDEVFKSNIDNIKKQNPDIKTDADLTKALKDAGLTMETLRQNFETAYLKYMVEQREVARNITLTEEEARQYYKAHPQEFMKPATVTLREILVSVPTQGTGAQATFNAAIADAAETKINSIRTRAAAGEDFLKLIAEASDSGTKANNGLIGPVVVDELNPMLAAALEKMQPGDITEPLRSRTGFQIFKLETRSAAEPEPFEKIRNEIAQKIYMSRRDTEMDKYLTKLRSQALIEWKDENFRKMYEQGFAKGKSGF
jgi:peptidyl-prolyl cis-trans isomerase SurA